MAESGRDQKRLSALLGPSEPEVGCDECFELIDQYVDLELESGDAAVRMPQMHAHFRGCPVCHGEFESLLALAGPAEPGTLPG